ncbi:MAG: hypothetical protein ABR588_02585 [Sphingomicrobium sp.]|nr:hypothetical protein [Sphingomonadales bacterium]
MAMLFLLLTAGAAATAQMPPARDAAASLPNPRTGELFEREPALKAWALRFYDGNDDGWLTAFEAQRAADAFRDLADSDRDGRVTTTEYRAAVAFVQARY